MKKIWNIEVVLQKLLNKNILITNRSYAKLFTGSIIRYLDS